MTDKNAVADSILADLDHKSGGNGMVKLITRRAELTPEVVEAAINKLSKGDPKFTTLEAFVWTQLDKKLEQTDTGWAIVADPKRQHTAGR